MDLSALDVAKEQKKKGTIKSNMLKTMVKKNETFLLVPHKNWIIL